MATRRSGYYKSSYAADMALFDTPYRKLFLGLFLLIVMSLPLVAGQQLLHVVNLTIIAIIGALALNLLTGYAGQLSLGHAAFLGVGGYASQYVSEFGLPFPVVVLLVTLFGAILGFLVGAPALRLRGLYLVLATVGFHYIAIYVIHVYHASGEDSIMVLTGFLLPTADLGFVELDSTVRWFYFFVFACVCVTAFCQNLVRTRVVEGVDRAARTGSDGGGPGYQPCLVQAEGVRHQFRVDLHGRLIPRLLFGLGVGRVLYARPRRVLSRDGRHRRFTARFWDRFSAPHSSPPCPLSLRGCSNSLRPDRGSNPRC